MGQTLLVGWRVAHLPHCSSFSTLPSPASASARFPEASVQLLPRLGRTRAIAHQQHLASQPDIFTKLRASKDLDVTIPLPRRRTISTLISRAWVFPGLLSPTSPFVPLLLLCATPGTEQALPSPVTLGRPSHRPPAQAGTARKYRWQVTQSRLPPRSSIASGRLLSPLRRPHLGIKHLVTCLSALIPPPYPAYQQPHLVMPFRAFPATKPARDAPPAPSYAPRLAPRRPEVVRPTAYVQDAMIDEFFGDTRAMKGKRPHAAHGLPQQHDGYGVELNYVDHNGIPWKDKVERQQHQELLSQRSRTQIAAADAAAGLRQQPWGTHMRNQRSYASFGSDSTPDEEADDHSSTGESFDSDLMDRHIRTASSEFTTFPPAGVDAVPFPGATYMPPKPKIVKGADAFPEPAPPRHLHPEVKAHAPRPHGSSRRRQAATTVPIAPAAKVDPVEQARLDFIRTALPPSAPPTRRPSPQGSSHPPTSRSPSNPRDVPGDFRLPRASFESRASSRAESSCPSLSKSSSASSRSPSSAASSQHSLPPAQPTSAPFKLPPAQPPQQQSVKEGRRASQPFAFLSRPSPSHPTPQERKKPSGPPTIQPRAAPLSHGPTKSISSTSLRARFNSFSRGSVSAVPVPVAVDKAGSGSDAGSLMGKNNVLGRGLGGLFKRSSRN